MLHQKKLMSNRQKTFAIVFIKNRIKKMEFLFRKVKTKFFLAKEHKKKKWLQYENNVLIKGSKVIFEVLKLKITLHICLIEVKREECSNLKKIYPEYKIWNSIRYWKIM